jgi:fumarylacetoacetase
MKLDATHDPALRSWVEPANDPASDFPIQNLPLGVFRRRGKREEPRAGVAIGDQILDLAALGVRSGPTLNALAAQGRNAARKIRREASKLLSSRNPNWKRLQKQLVPMKRAQMLLPVTVGDYSDFYTGIHHATNIGRILRPDNPLLPNYKWVPIGYHGRSSTIVVSGTPVTRPAGQIKPPDAPAPVFAPSRRLDYEVELGFIAGRGNRHGQRIAVRRGAAERLVGARPAGLGIPAARPVPREKLRHDHFSVGRDAGRARALPLPGVCARRGRSQAPALPARRRGPAERGL